MEPKSNSWGGWTLDRDRLVLEFKSHEVDLERALSGAQVCDWIFQVAHKSWATPEVLTGLIRAFHDLLEPQAHLCSGGENKIITRQGLAQLVDKTARG